MKHMVNGIEMEMEADDAKQLMEEWAANDPSKKTPALPEMTLKDVVQLLKAKEIFTDSDISAQVEVSRVEVSTR